MSSSDDGFLFLIMFPKPREVGQPLLSFALSSFVSALQPPVHLCGL